MPESLISEISYFSFVKRCTREGRTLERSVIVVVFFEFLNSGYSNCRLGGRSVILDPLLELHYGSQQILLLRGRSRLKGPSVCFVSAATDRRLKPPRAPATPPPDLPSGGALWP